MKRFLRLLVWDGLFCIVPTIGYAASCVLTSSTAAYIINLLVWAICGAFLCQLSRWGCGIMELIVVGLPALYLIFAPFSAPLLNAIPIPFDLVPAVLLASKTVLLRTTASLVAGFLIWQKVFIRVS